MDLPETFTLNATASLVFYVEGNDFDNNFSVADEYGKWYQETLNSDTLWCQFTDVYLECSVRLKETNRPMYPRLLSGDRTAHVKCIMLRNKLYVELQILVGITPTECTLELPFYRHG